MRTIPLAVLALSAALAVTGCATKKDFYAMGGSRADGTVDMAYDFRQFEKPVVNVEQAKTIAKSKCRVWGYQDAEMFGGKRQQCHQIDGWGNCVAGQVTIQFQCIGSGDSGSSISTYAPAPNSAPAAVPGSLSRETWKQQQIDQLNRETGLSYEEYQRRYREIVGQ